MALSVLIPIPSVLSQLQSNDTTPENLDSQLSSEHTFTPEYIDELELFASNGTSFDTYITQSLDTMKQLQPSDVFQNEFIKILFAMSEPMNSIISLCSLPEVQTVSLPQCDSAAAIVHELCQGIRFEVSLCSSPHLPNYINSRNMSEEQTSMLAYSYMLNLMTQK